MELIKFRVTYNNGDIKFGTIQEIRLNLLRSNSYPVKYELFTGLFDINNEEIYENDKVRFYINKFTKNPIELIGKIVYKEENAAFFKEVLRKGKIRHYHCSNGYLELIEN